MPPMRFTSALLAAVLCAPGCGTTSYEIPHAELARLAQVPPEQRGLRVRVIQLLHDAEVGPEQPVDAGAHLDVFPEIEITGPARGRYWRPQVADHRTAGGGAGLRVNTAHGGGHTGGGLHLGGSAGDGKGEAIALLVVAVTILFVAAAVEGSRFDGYAQMHPMMPVYLFGRDGGTTAMPLAWIDPATAAWADHGIVRSDEGPWRTLERAPLSREGFTYAVLGGVGTYTSADGTTAPGVATTIQAGFFANQQIGVLGSVFFGWRDNALGGTLFESRYLAELDGYPIHAGPLHLGLYGGAGAAYRWEDRIEGADSASLALEGGALLQLDVNTRLALTARLGETYAHGEGMPDAIVGLSVY
jgi:hypothetical protein